MFLLYTRAYDKIRQGNFNSKKNATGRNGAVFCVASPRRCWQGRHAPRFRFAAPGVIPSAASTRLKLGGDFTPRFRFASPGVTHGATSTRLGWLSGHSGQTGGYLIPTLSESPDRTAKETNRPDRTSADNLIRQDNNPTKNQCSSVSIRGLKNRLWTVVHPRDVVDVLRRPRAMPPGSASLRLPWAFMLQPSVPSLASRLSLLVSSQSGILFFFFRGGAYRSHSKFPKRASICLLTAPSLPLIQEVTKAWELG